MDDDRHVGAYSWHQSLDQATINIFVPNETILDDLEVLIDPPYLVAGIRGQLPLLKGKIYDTVNREATHWNFEPTDSPRRRTTSTASTMSTQSSYAYVSDQEYTSSFAASLDSAQTSDNDSDAASPERVHEEQQHSQVTLQQQQQRLGATVPAFPQRAIHSYPASPQATSLDSSISSLDSLQQERAARLLTIVLVKERPTYWPRVIDGSIPDSYSPTPTGPFTHDDEVECAKYNMDPTTLGLLGEEYLKTRGDKDEAFEYFVRSWYYLHTPFSTMRLVGHFIPVTTVLPSSLSLTPQSYTSVPRRGTAEYYLHCLGGTQGLAQLFLEAGLAHVDGIASKMLSSSYSPLNSIRRSEPPPSSAAAQSRQESSTQIWKRDRACARTYFERARRMAPNMDGMIPYLPEETDLRGFDRPGRVAGAAMIGQTQTQTAGEVVVQGPELQMPSMYLEDGKTLRPAEGAASSSGAQTDEKAKPESTIHLRRRRQQASEALMEQTKVDEDEDSTWYLYLPGLVGAGTALLVVSVVGALSFQSWRKHHN